MCIAAIAAAGRAFERLLAVATLIR